MNILILNGAPAGDNSITLQTVNFLAALYPKINFEILHVGQKIRKYEKDFTEAEVTSCGYSDTTSSLYSLTFASLHERRIKDKRKTAKNSFIRTKICYISPQK